jgi:hypothetical protein
VGAEDNVALIHSPATCYSAQEVMLLPVLNSNFPQQEKNVPSKQTFSRCVKKSCTLYKYSPLIFTEDEESQKKLGVW